MPPPHDTARQVVPSSQPEAGGGRTLEAPAAEAAGSQRAVPPGRGHRAWSWWAARPTLAAAVIYALLSLVFVGQGLLPGRTLSSSDYLWSVVPWTSSRPADVPPLGSNFEPAGRGRRVPPLLRVLEGGLPRRRAVESAHHGRTTVPGQLAVGAVLAVHLSRLRAAAIQGARGHGAAQALRRRVRDLSLRARARTSLRRGVAGGGRVHLWDLLRGLAAVDAHEHLPPHTVAAPDHRALGPPPGAASGGGTRRAGRAAVLRWTPGDELPPDHLHHDLLRLPAPPALAPGKARPAGALPTRARLRSGGRCRERRGRHHADTAVRAVPQQRRLRRRQDIDPTAMDSRFIGACSSTTTGAGRRRLPGSLREQPRPLRGRHHADARRGRRGAATDGHAARVRSVRGAHPRDRLRARAAVRRPDPAARVCSRATRER